MTIEKLLLNNFRIHNQKTFDFSSKINCIVGSNGVGKTNVLEAIHFLAITKGFVATADRQCINHQASFFSIEAQVHLDDKTDKFSCFVQQNKPKKMMRNKKVFSKLVDYIGLLPLVVVSPYDRDIITESADARRKFLDAFLCQMDKAYLATLIHYNKVLAQRNALLKTFAKSKKFDPVQLQIYNDQLHQYGHTIYDKRKAFIDIIGTKVADGYKQLAPNAEVVTVRYKSQLETGKLTVLLDQNSEKDKALQHTSVGIHRDDLVFELNRQPMRVTASQGQQKSFLIALKLALYNHLKASRGVKPLLLLDDVFDKLDDHRVNALITLVNGNHFGQIFITDTHKERIEQLMARVEVEHRIFEL